MMRQDKTTRVVAVLCFLVIAALPVVLLAQDDFFQVTEPEIEEITPDMLDNEEMIIYIHDRWRFQIGDNTDWASPDYEDSDWDFISTNLTPTELAFLDWNGIGWFRKTLSVHPELTGKPLALIIDRHLGASEIYLNGEKVAELGTFSENPDQVVSYNDRKPIPIVFSNEEVQTLAVRFTNPNYIYTEMLIGYNGFRFLLGDWQTHQDESYNFIANLNSSSMFYVGLLLAFAIIHFLLFAFYPAEWRNLYFSIFVGFLAVLSYVYFRMELYSHTFESLDLFHYLLVTEVLVLTFATRFTHSIDDNFAPFYKDIMVVIGILTSILVWLFPAQMFFIREIILLVFILEILRTIAVMLYKNRSGVWLLGVGVLLFLIALVSTVLININIIPGNVQFVNMAGSSGLILAMSIFLSRDFAFTQKNLESKLKEVQVLNKKTLEQERINKEREIEKRLLEAENERKTRELEEARALQLSMLPQKMPSVNGYDIAVFMETATEVGGDYYDYSIEQDGTLVLALGDATGHGMKAGIMVAAAKSYFHTLVHEADSLTLLKRMSNGLRNLDMKLMYMGFMVVQCKQDEFEIATAGMPPVLHFKNRERRVDDVVLKGLPLGSSIDYPYERKKIQLGQGDVLLMMSDGLMELFDPNREMLGTEKIAEILKNSNSYSAGDIINQLTQLIERWSGGKEPDDDITMMVLKIPE